MKVLRYEDSLEHLIASPDKTIFLAGPTVRGNQPHLTSWRFAAIKEFERQGFNGTLIIPEFSDKHESDKGKFWIPKWEYTGLTACDIIMFWIPRTKELIGLTTNHEHGYWMGRCKKKMVYGRPDDAYRMSYLDIMWEINDLGFDDNPLPILKTLEDTVRTSIEHSEKAHRLYRDKTGVVVDK